MESVRMDWMRSGWSWLSCRLGLDGGLLAAIAAGLPCPKVYLIETGAMNAFATGMSPDKSAVAVTRGLRDKLTREELRGVMAHELAHVGNFDTRIMVLMGVIVGSVAILSDFFRDRRGKS